MLRISEIKISLNDDTKEYFESEIRRILRLRRGEKMTFDICRKSVDARKKNDVHFVYSVDADVGKAESRVLKLGLKNIKKREKQDFEIMKTISPPKKRPVICGFGPAGMFCALILARAGAEPVVLERGGDVDSRMASVKRFFEGGRLDVQSNVQFGEGGAGTFSDGKLTCGLNDSRMNFVLNEFVKFGADEEILYSAKPHIGTDVLKNVVKNLREHITSLGAQIYFNTQLTGIETKNGHVCGAVCETEGAKRVFECDTLIMAIGHSARDTFEMMYEKGFEMRQKPFSIGVRIEHEQEMINRAQYGKFAGHSALGAADYKLACKTSQGRGVYTFCMCPGGDVVAAASEEGGVVTNGMSLRARGGKNANSALLCDVYTSDFQSNHPLAGVDFQRRWERAAYVLGGRTYKAPVNLVGAFMRGKVAGGFGKILPTYRPGTVFAPIEQCLPEFAGAALREAIGMFDARLKGFGDSDAVMTGVETRSSSPVRIVRDKNFESSLGGVFPCGEGAGYAGGIMSAALDGIKVACEILESLS